MEWDVWFQSKTFTSDWTSQHFPNWAKHLAPLRDRDAAVLEIGSWEGRSAIFFLEHLPRCRITCVDTFEGGAEHAEFDQAIVSSIEARFDANLTHYGDRVRKMKSRSLPALDRLAQEGQTFGLIYIDGSHARDDVLLDSLLAWRLLAPNGICIWDDYTWGVHDRTAAQRPGQAIDAFINMHADELEILDTSSQIIALKRLSAGSPRDHFLTFPRTPKNLMRFLTRKPLQQ